MKILAISCTHGKLPCGFKDYIKENNIDMIISLGDHCDGDKIRNILFENWDFFKDKKYYAALKELLGEKKYKKILRYFATSGKKILSELNSLNIPILVLYGNNDFLDEDRKESRINIPTLEEICNKMKNLILLDGDKYEINDFTIIGIGGYRGTSLKSGKHEKSNKINQEFKEKFENGFKRTESNRTILVSHDQPINTKFDKINYPSSPMHGKSLGDDIIRESIEEHKPILYIGGHMHEHHGISKLEETILVAAGYGRDGQCVVFELPSLKVETVTI